jgi:hypothetical protein
MKHPGLVISGIAGGVIILIIVIYLATKTPAITPPTGATILPNGAVGPYNFNGATIPVGNKTFVGANGYFTCPTGGNGYLSKAKIPYPTITSVPSWTTIGGMVAEYLAVCAAALGDGCGYSTTDIANRQADCADFGFVIPPVSSMHT